MILALNPRVEKDGKKERLKKIKSSHEGWVALANIIIKSDKPQTETTRCVRKKYENLCRKICEMIFFCLLLHSHLLLHLTFLFILPFHSLSHFMFHLTGFLCFPFVIAVSISFKWNFMAAQFSNAKHEFIYKLVRDIKIEIFFL